MVLATQQSTTVAVAGPFGVPRDAVQCGTAAIGTFGIPIRVKNSPQCAFFGWTRRPCDAHDFRPFWRPDVAKCIQWQEAEDEQSHFEINRIYRMHVAAWYNTMQTVVCNGKKENEDDPFIFILFFFINITIAPGTQMTRILHRKIRRASTAPSPSR
ncbi:hypothetical protein BST61_g9273 [Cercospora zeina]